MIVITKVLLLKLSRTLYAMAYLQFLSWNCGPISLQRSTLLTYSGVFELRIGNKRNSARFVLQKEVNFLFVINSYNTVTSPPPSSHPSLLIFLQNDARRSPVVANRNQIPRPRHMPNMNHHRHPGTSDKRGLILIHQHAHSETSGSDDQVLHPELDLDLKWRSKNYTQTWDRTQDPQVRRNSDCKITFSGQALRFLHLNVSSAPKTILTANSGRSKSLRSKFCGSQSSQTE